MTSILIWILPPLACYVAGSIPFSFLAVRYLTGTDLRNLGSGNPGATNALRTAGPGVALLGLSLDVAKGFVPVWLARLGGLPDGVLALCAVACVLGHVFSPILRFRGGKGVATGFGALSALNPLATAGSLGVFAFVLLLFRIVSLASISAVATLPLLWPAPELLGAAPAAGGFGWVAVVSIAALVLLRHAGNIRRLRSGEESRLGGRPA